MGLILSSSDSLFFSFENIVFYLMIHSYLVEKKPCSTSKLNKCKLKCSFFSLNLCLYDNTLLLFICYHKMEEFFFFSFFCHPIYQKTSTGILLLVLYRYVSSTCTYYTWELLFANSLMLIFAVSVFVKLCVHIIIITSDG